MSVADMEVIRNRQVLCKECDEIVDANGDGWNSYKHGENSICEDCYDKEALE